MGRGSRGRSSGRPFIRRAGSSSASSGVGGCEDDSELPWKDWKEEMMLLPLEERCEIASEMYTKSIRESDVSFAAIFSKLLVGCHEKYFDVDSIARNFDRTMLEEERLDNEKRLMRWPLELRCRHVARAYAQGILGSDPHLVAMCKKLMVGCPEKYLDIAISSNKKGLRIYMKRFVELFSLTRYDRNKDELTYPFKEMNVEYIRYPDVVNSFGNYCLKFSKPIEDMNCRMLEDKGEGSPAVSILDYMSSFSLTYTFHLGN